MTIWWHSVNTALPIADAATYLHTAQSISQKFDLDGIGAGLLALYLDRGWRPIIYPALSVPFHWIDKADIGVIVSSSSIFFTTLLCYWTYRCFAAVLPMWRAALATICCTTVPFHLVFSLNFFSELPLLAFATGAVAHLIQSKSFQEERHTRACAMLLALASCTRPVEAVLTFAPIILFAVWLGYRRRAINRRDVLAAIGLVITAAVLLASQFYEPLNIRRLPDGIMCGLMLAFLLGGLGWLAVWRQRPLVEATCLSALIFLFWWLPSIRDLFVWAVAGAAVDGTIQIWQAPDALALLKSVVQDVGIVQFSVLALIFSCLLYRRIANSSRILSRTDDRWLLLAALPLGLVPALLPMLILGQADDPRRALLATALAEIAILGIALRPGWPLARPFAAAVIATCAVQFLVIVTFANDRFPAALAGIQARVKVLEVDAPLPPYRVAPGPDQRVMAFLESSLPKGAGIVLIAGHGRLSRPPNDEVVGAFEDYALGILIDRRPQRMWSRIPDLSQPYDRFLDQIYLFGGRFIVLGNTMSVLEDPEAAWQIQDAIVNTLARKQLLPNYDLVEVGRTQVPERGDAVLLKLSPRDHTHTWEVSTVVGSSSNELAPEGATRQQSETGHFISDGDAPPSSDLSPRQASAAVWVSSQQDDEIPGNAWLGYVFATPQTVRQIRLQQPIDQHRQDLVQVEKSIDGAMWTAAAALPFRLAASEATSIILPDGPPARYWRIVAAGLEGAGKTKRVHDDWRISGLEFLVPSHGDGLAIGSGEADPERAFADNLAAEWVSSEHGGDVKGHAWVGYAFDMPQIVQRIEFTQTTNRPYRQDRVMVQASDDAGLTWRDALREPATLSDQGTARIDLPNLAPATHWRVVAAGDNATDPSHSWAIAGLGFFLVPNSDISSSYVAANLADGSAMSSGPDPSAAANAFDGDPTTYWYSPEHGRAVKDHAWIGYRFSQPLEIRRIDLKQSPHHVYRQDRVRVEKSVDGGNTWQPAAPAPILLMAPLSRIILPAGEPARLWRVVAAADNATKDTEAWAVETVNFYTPTEEAMPVLVALPSDSGKPIASGADGANAPESAFDGDPVTYWLSPERGSEVKDHAWIGYAFAVPREIRQVHIEQPPDLLYRQDLVRVEKSVDRGKTWQPAAPGPIRLAGTASEIDLPAGEPAAHWRIVAASDNVGSEHAWAVNELKFFAAPMGRPAVGTTSGGK